MERFMKIALSYILVILCLTMLSACKQDIASVVAREGALTLAIYDEGHLVLSNAIPVGSQQKREIVAWTKRNEEGWRYSPVTYAPRILIIGSTFQLNITPTMALFGEGSQQYVKQISAEDYEALRLVLTTR
jgi:hypothetical protein